MTSTTRFDRTDEAVIGLQGTPALGVEGTSHMVSGPSPIYPSQVLGTFSRLSSGRRQRRSPDSYLAWLRDVLLARRTSFLLLLQEGARFLQEVFLQLPFLQEYLLIYDIHWCLTARGFMGWTRRGDGSRKTGVGST